jgi:hypothetical protein
MGPELEREAPNVVTEAGFRSLLQSAYHAEVVCKCTAENRRAVWYREWIIRAVDSTQKREKLLVLARRKSGDADEVVARTFKTANGLISFLYSMGFAQISIPLYKGGRSSQVLTHSPSALTRR